MEIFRSFIVTNRISWKVIMLNQTKYRGLTFLYLFSTLILIITNCYSPSQVIEHSGQIQYTENLIPGVEPEEAVDKIVIAVQGTGIAPVHGSRLQKRYMAERAAVIDGYRKISERLAGMIINAQTISGGNAVSMDEVMIATNSYLRGAQVGEIVHKEGYATAHVTVHIMPRAQKFYYGPFSSKEFLDALPRATIGDAGRSNDG